MTYRATAVGADTLLSQIIRGESKTQGAKPLIQAGCGRSDYGRGSQSLYSPVGFFRQRCDSFNITAIRPWISPL
jgi:hypothetical protein